MWEGIQASGREMVLTVEGAPDNALCSAGGCGNAKRVGHDINANWMSMTSLVDIASGLWPFAHNSSNPQFGGWWSASRSAPLSTPAPPLALSPPHPVSTPLPLPAPDDLDMMCVGAR